MDEDIGPGASAAQESIVIKNNPIKKKRDKTGKFKAGPSK
jgi:hypothetical protein